MTATLSKVDREQWLIRAFQFGFSTGQPNLIECIRAYVKAYPDQFSISEVFVDFVAKPSDHLMLRILQSGDGEIDRFRKLQRFVAAHPEFREEALAAALAFEQGCCYCPRQAAEKADMDTEQFTEWLADNGYNLPS